MKKEYRLVIAGCRSFNNYCKISCEVKKEIKKLKKATRSSSSAVGQREPMLLEKDLHDGTA